MRLTASLLDERIADQPLCDFRTSYYSQFAGPLSLDSDPWVVRVSELKSDEQCDLEISRRVHPYYMPGMGGSSPDQTVLPGFFSLCVFRPFDLAGKEAAWAGTDKEDYARAAAVPLVHVGSDVVVKEGKRFWFACEFDAAAKKLRRNPAMWITAPAAGAPPSSLYDESELRLGWVGKRKPIAYDQGCKCAQEGFLAGPQGFDEVELLEETLETLAAAAGTVQATELDLDRPLVIKAAVTTPVLGWDGKPKTLQDAGPPDVPHATPTRTYKTYFRKLYVEIDDAGVTDPDGKVKMAEGETGLVQLVQEGEGPDEKYFVEAFFGETDAQGKPISRRSQLSGLGP